MGLCCEPGEMEVSTAKHRPGDLKKLAPDYELRKQVTTLFAQKGLGEEDGMPMETAIPLLQDIIAQKTKGKAVVQPTEEQLTRLFNEIDVDGNQTIEVEEMVTFLKRSDYNLETMISKSPQKQRRSTITGLKQNQLAELENANETNMRLRNRAKALQKALPSFDYTKFKPDPKVRLSKPKRILDNGNEYEGEWDEEGKRDGRGVLHWVDGGIYEGYFANDMANGLGRMIHADGDMYDGNWVNDKHQGFGVYSHADGAKYEGQWLDDKQHGPGREYWPNGDNYEGGFMEGKKHGEGVQIWVNGNKYEGQYWLNEIQGHGKYTWADGKSYEGQWKNNKMDGEGVLILADRTKYTG